MSKNVCSHCGHLNLKRALFCFECGTPLQRDHLLAAMKPRHHSLKHRTDEIETAFGPPQVEETPQPKKAHDSFQQYNSLLRCLRCGGDNSPDSAECQRCGASLVVPDEIYHLTLAVSARSNMGQVRANNEDKVGIWARGGVVLALVADGMGGAAAGEEASRLAKEAIQADFTGAARGSEILQELSEDEVQQKLRDALCHANEALLERIGENKSFQGMGTTATLALFRGSRVVIAHVGDSRAYLIDGNHGWVHQITDDHSFVEVLVASGHITRQQATAHPMRSVLYRALGQTDTADADLYSRHLKAGDRLILSSDGLPRHLSPEDIATIALRSEDPDVITQELIDLANQRGGEDNISVVVVVAKQDPGSAPLEQLVVIPAEEERASDETLDLFRTAKFGSLPLPDKDPDSDEQG